MPLDDNTRSGLHYLTLGVVVVFAAMLVDRVLSGFADPADASLAVLEPFQHGYLLGNGVHVVDSASTRGERIALVVVITVITGILLGLVMHRIVRNRRITLASARLVMVLLLGWGTYAALFLPARHFFLRDQQVVEWRYTAVFGDLPIPFTREVKLHQGEVVSSGADVIEDVSPCGVRYELFLRGKEDVRMAWLVPPGYDCPGEMERVGSECRQAAEVINAHLRRP